jgi:uncharacterized Zn finger protein (UPF0148 family)
MDKETLKEVKHNCEGCQGKGYLDKTDGYDYGKVVCPVCINDKEPKQETIEEAAERHYINCIPSDRHSFITGAKWQSKRMYTEEEVLDILFKHTEYFAGFGVRLSLTDWFELQKK